MSPSLLISAGGTGGGIYPALSVAESLQRLSPDTSLHFVGSADGMEAKLVPHELFAAYHAVQSGPLNGVGVVRAAVSAIKLAIGILQSIGLILRLHPAGLFLTGGWATFPIALACWLLRVPIAIYVPDIEPALAIKFLSRLARIITVTTAESAPYFPASIPRERIIETGYPLRPPMLKAARPEAIQHFKLDPARKTLLVWGGSRGSRSINEALGAILPDLLGDGLQVIHVSGELDWAAVQARREWLSDNEKLHYHAFPYLHDDMALAFAAADIAASRGGASSLGEYPHFGLPAILVPYPYAWRYQKVNADWLASRGAAIRLDDGALRTDLLPTIRKLVGDPARLAAFGEASRKLARSDAADAIARTVLKLINP